ncbi:MAG: alpha/beta hydrolase [Patescibacteria group bacterium]|nr:alpha/beta hydrolase [Patescibacteria group bacterium]
MLFVIFHGSFGSPEGNWFPELKEKLELFGQDVLVPKFPVEEWNEISENSNLKSQNYKTKNQNLENWLKVFEKKVLPRIKKAKKVCFVGHSLGPVFILHLVNKFNIKLDSAIFVSPFLSDLGGDPRFKLVNKTFYKKDFDFKRLKKLIPISYVLYSENDPYVDKKYMFEFGKKMDSSLIEVRRAGHMNSEVNLNEFPLVLELCKTRLDLNLYQKYLAHRKELFSIDYMKKSKEEEVIYIKPKEVFDEGLFKFRNLRKYGFCTFFSDLKFWDAQSNYFKEARRAAKRIKKFTRVFVIRKVSDLKRKLFLKQIKLDFEAGIKTYLVMWEDIESIGCEPDYGVWDDDYLCVVKVEKGKKPEEVMLSSRKSNIQKAKKWSREILKRAMRVSKFPDDIAKFVKGLK